VKVYPALKGVMTHGRIISSEVYNRVWKGTI